VKEYLRAGRVDELHVAIAPILLGAGERLWDGLDAGIGGLTCVELVSSPAVVHARFARS
jgi:dihydrofolate reductase